jgi:hypothetical protein
MINNFDIIDNVLFRKKDLELLVGDDCSQWVINKGISFHSTVLAQFINTTANIYGKYLEPQQYIDYINTIIPKTQYRKIEWLKSEKTIKTPIPNIAQLAEYYECSQREIKELFTDFPDMVEEEQENNLKKYKRKSK